MKFTFKNITLLLIILFGLFGQNIYGQYSEYEIKAQYINLFTKYIEWPESSEVNSSEIPFRICVIGENPFGDIFLDLSRFAKLKGKKIEYKKVDLSSIEKCDILYISKSEEKYLDEILDRAQGLGILLISDGEGFAEKGVMINFFVENEKIRFEINKKSADKEGVKISSRLLKLARIVE